MEEEERKRHIVYLLSFFVRELGAFSLFFLFPFPFPNKLRRTMASY
jgi:hypothetical protein